MSIRLRLVMACLLALGLVVVGCGSGSSRVVPGAQAPDFTLPALEGGTVSLEGLRGSPVMINFWATWCPTCRAEMPHIEAAFQEMRAAGLVVLAVDIAEDRSTVEQYIKEEGFTFTVLLDSDGSVAARYGVTAVPETVFVDRDGVVRLYKAGPFASKEEIIAGLRSIME
jgi:peroxiredoxin